MLKRTMVVGLVLNACLIGAGFAVAQRIDREAKAAADAMVSRFVDSWNRADGAAYGENYWPEAELVNPSGAIRNGKAAIVKEHVDLWAGIFKGTHIAAHVRRIQRLGPNYLIVDVDLELRGVRQFPPGTPQTKDGVLRNHLKHILEKRHGAWKVISAQNTFIAGT